MSRARQAAVAGIVLALTACSNGGSVPATARLPAVTDVVRGAHAKLTIRIRVPRRRGKHGRYISPSTQGMTIALAQPDAYSVTFGLTPYSPNCTNASGSTLCTFTLSLAPCSSGLNCYAGSVTTYDAVSCTLYACTIPAGAHALSSNQDVSFTVAAGRNNALSLTLDGIPAGAVILPGTSSTLSGNAKSGFTISKCVTAPQAVTVAPVDADGDQIVGPGAPTAITLTSDDGVHLAVATPPPTGPADAFALVPPASLASATIPNAHAVVHLNADASPLAASGATPPPATASTVTFGSDVCGVITEFSSGITAGAIPATIVAGPDGNLWFTESANAAVGRITTTGQITEYSVAGANWGMAVGSDGNLWFDEPGNVEVQWIGTNGIANGPIAIPTPDGSAPQPNDMALGSDGEIYFTETAANDVRRVTTTETFGHVNLPTPPPAQPGAIASGPDGRLWFTEAGANSIGRFITGASVSTQVVEFSIPTSSAVPSGIAAGADGALWFTENGGGKIGRIPTSASAVSPQIVEFTFSTAGHRPYAITAGPDGALWFTECPALLIGRIPTSASAASPQITEYTVQTVGATITSIAAGPDGALWFVEGNANKIGRVQ